jgi:hypothetical protein
MDVFRNFCRVLQIFPKHLKIYQYKSCAESPWTHFIFKVALLVLSGKGVNLLRKLRITIHPRHKNLQVGIWISFSIWIQFTFGFSHILEGRSIYNFHVYQLWSLHVNFWELCKQTGAHRSDRAESALRRDVARSGVTPCVADAPPPCAAVPRPVLGVSAWARCASAPHAPPGRVSAGEPTRHTACTPRLAVPRLNATVASTWSEYATARAYRL